ncbi:MAG: Gfo/Idh/MocA family oxidoreductase [Spartobacteria bacterium]|nr:Gfo/Idh/MocA family oxidoreductase [Spartobacteria bacterium]
MIEGSKMGQSSSLLRYGMIGGGQGAFIGDVHRLALRMDHQTELVAGCFSRSYENTKETGLGLGLAEDRLYASFEEMAEKESQREDRMDFVVIVTPNFSHYAAAKTFLEHGFNVVCDKPLTPDTEQAEELVALAKAKGLLFCVTYTYTGYATVKQAKEMIRQGDIGDIRFVHAEYPQEWLATPVETEGQKQAAWRTDPAQSGKSNCVGDIGSHIENLVSYVTDLKIDALCARLDTMDENRKLDDNATIMINYKGSAKGLYWCSQIAIGHDNGLRLNVYGTKGSIEWSQEDPNYLKVTCLGTPAQKLSRGRDPFYPHAASYPRIPSGHPEGYFEAFANLYKTFTGALIKKKQGVALTADDLDFPTVENGLEGVRFINACVESSSKGAVWVSL